MARLKDLLSEARALGVRHGTGTADWYFDRCDNLSREDYLRVLKGIEDCDPEILDTFNDSPLSGEWADDLTPKKLWDELGANEQQRIVAGDEICDEFAEAFRSAYSDRVSQICTEHLRTTYLFRIELELVEQDPKAVMSAMLDAALKMNVSLVEEDIAEDGEVIG